MAEVAGMIISVDKNESFHPSSSDSLHKYSPGPYLRRYKSCFHHVSNNKKYLTRLQRTLRPLWCVVDKRITNVDCFLLSFATNRRRNRFPRTLVLNVSVFWGGWQSLLWNGGFKGSLHIQRSHHKWLLYNFYSMYQALLNKNPHFLCGNVPHICDRDHCGVQSNQRLLVCLM